MGWQMAFGWKWQWTYCRGSAGRVPALIVYAPGLPGGRVTDALVSGIDMMPTCLDLAGLPPVAGVDGQSFAPLLRGETENACDAIFSERGQWCMIVKNGWKLAAERQDDGLAPTFMTHLDGDPFELQNRVEDHAVADLRNHLLAQLASWDAGVRAGNRGLGQQSVAQRGGKPRG